MTTSLFKKLSVFGLLVLGCLTWLGASPASAHTGEQSYVFVQVFDDGISGRLEFPLRDLNEVLGLGLDTEDEEQALADLDANRDQIVAYADDHFRIGLDEQVEWQVEYGEWEFLEVEFGNYALLNYDVTTALEPPPRVFEVTFDPFFEEIDGYFGLLTVETDFRGGVFNNEGDWLVAFNKGDARQVVDLDDSSLWKGIKGTIELGMEHIFIGTDHILFVVVLLIPSVLVFSTARGWDPSDGFRDSFVRVLKIATSFTVAHSVTLMLAGFDIVEFNSKLVETVIAASIVVAAAHNLKPILPNRETIIAFGFGLVHGLGFAGLLSDLGLDRTNRVWSLIGFNLGVEIGQVAIILLVFPVLFLLRRTRYYDIILKGGSIAIAVVACIWVAERIAEDDFGITSTIDKIVQRPRIVVLLAIAAVVAAGVRELEKRANRLRPTHAELADA